MYVPESRALALVTASSLTRVKVVSDLALKKVWGSGIGRGDIEMERFMRNEKTSKALESKMVKSHRLGHLDLYRNVSDTSPSVRWV